MPTTPSPQDATHLKLAGIDRAGGTSARTGRPSWWSRQFSSIFRSRSARVMGLDDIAPCSLHPSRSTNTAEAAHGRFLFQATPAAGWPGEVQLDRKQTG